MGEHAHRDLADEDDLNREVQVVEEPPVALSQGGGGLQADHPQRHEMLPLFSRTMAFFVIPLTALTVTIVVAREVRRGRRG